MALSRAKYKRRSGEENKNQDNLKVTVLKQVSKNLLPDKFSDYKIVNLRKLNHFKYGPKVIRLILNFELVKCCLLYFSQVNNYNLVKAGSLFYSPGKNYRWPVKTVPLREFSVRSL